jgi:hypothetical protein
MQYAHWLIVAGAVLVVLEFIGFAFHKNDAGTTEGHLTRDTSSETIQAALEEAEAALEAKLARVRFVSLSPANKRSLLAGGS